MGSCSSSNSNSEQRDVINVTVLKPPTHAQGTEASHVVSKEMKPQHERKETKKNDEKEKKKERKKDDAADSEKDKKKDKDGKKKDNDGKKKEHKDRNKRIKADKKDDDTKELKKEKKKTKKRNDKTDVSKEESSSSDSSSSAEDEADAKQVSDGDGGAAASKIDTPLSDGGDVDTTVKLSGDAADDDKRNAAADVGGARIAEVAPAVPLVAGQVVTQADPEASVSVEAHIDLSDQSQTTKNDANVTIKMTEDVGGDCGGPFMSVDIVLNPGGDVEVVN